MLLRKTKIIATLGPASADQLEALLRAGVDVFRLNMTHASADWCRGIVAGIRDARRTTGRDAAVLMDLRGPTIRTGDLPEPVSLKPGDAVEFLLSGSASTQPIATSVNYPDLYLDVKVGDTVLVDNGILQMRVAASGRERILCRVLNSGMLGSRRHINLPGIRVNLPPLTDKDRADIDLAVETGADYIAMSFVRDASHLQLLRRELKARGCGARIVAKIEDQQAVHHLDEIVSATDSVMVARGDLGIEVYLEELPVIQRRIVNKSVHLGRPVIVATHMLESMIEHPVPTRAEVTDVANAVFEEADAVMLSGETSSGAWPVRCVEVMDKIARRVEVSAADGESRARFAIPGDDKQRIVKHSVALADSIPDSAIVVITQRGVLARYAAWFRPQRAPIFAFAPTDAIARSLHLCRAVCPFALEFVPGETEATIAAATRVLLDARLVRPGSSLVIISDVLQGEYTMDSILVQRIPKSERS